MMCELDPVFTAMANERRRIALYFLQKHRTVSLPDLAELVAEREYGKNVCELSGDRVKRLYLAFYHDHIPVLENADLVRYEQESDLVVRSEDLRSKIESAREQLQMLTLREPDDSGLPH